MSGCCVAWLARWRFGKWGRGEGGGGGCSVGGFTLNKTQMTKSKYELGLIPSLYLLYKYISETETELV